MHYNEWLPWQHKLLPSSKLTCPFDNLSARSSRSIAQCPLSVKTIIEHYPNRT